MVLVWYVMKSVLCGVMQTDAPESMMSRLLSLVMVFRHVGLFSVVMWVDGEVMGVGGGEVMVRCWIVMMSLGSWCASRAVTELRGMVGSLWCCWVLLQPLV